MRRRSYYKKSNAGRIIILLLIAAAVTFGTWYRGLFNPGFDADYLVENSRLKRAGFETNVEELVSRKGIKAYYMEERTNPIISVYFLFRGAGASFDQRGKEGLAHVTAALMTEGAGDLDSREFKEILEDKAISISFAADDDDVSGSLLTLKENQKEAFELLRTVLTEPRFDSKETELVKQQMLAVLERQKEYPDSVLEQLWRQEIFGAHPYGRNSLGRAEDIVRINRDVLQRRVRESLTKDRLIVGIAGDISKQEALKMLDRVFGALPEKGKKTANEDAKPHFDGREKVIPRDLAQDIAIFAAEGTARNNPDFYPLYIANQIFGGQGLTSRLSLAAREDEALTYGIYSYLSLKDDAAFIRGGFSATPDKFARVKEIVGREWQRMAEEGVSDEEVEAAKKYLTASYNLRFASIANISAILAAMQREKLGIDFLQKRNSYVEAVTTEQVNEAAKKYFGAGQPVWVSLGK